MADLVGKDSHTQLQVEVVRNLFLCRGSIIPRAYSEVWWVGQALGRVCQSGRGQASWGGSAKVGGGRPAGEGPGAGAGEGLPKVSPASAASVVGCQFQEVSMATLMRLKEHCQVCEHMLRWRSCFQGKDWYSV